LLAHGAAHVVASAKDDLQARLGEIAGAVGARVVFDPVGGRAFGPLTAAMSRGGILIEYGGLSPEPTPFPLAAMLCKSLTHEVVRDPERLAAAKRFVIDGLASGVEARHRENLPV
jgi:NADPH:quinone reductase-like Zn-dependent oxidoreductase